jgi:hypothetical protein
MYYYIIVFMSHPEKIDPTDLGPINEDEVTAFIRHIDSIATAFETDDNTWREEIINEAKAWFKDHPDIPAFDGFEQPND